MSSYIITNTKNNSTNSIELKGINFSIAKSDEIKIKRKNISLAVYGDFYEKNTEALLGKILDNSLDHGVIIKAIKSQIDGRYLFVITDDQSDKVYVSIDKLGKQNLFYRKIEENFYISNEIGSLKSTGQVSYDSFAVSHIMINSTGPRAPRKHSTYKEIKGLGVNEYLVLTQNSLETAQFEYDLQKIQNYSPEKLEEYGQLFLDAVKRMSNPHENIVLLSSGWDSTAILATLVHLHGPKAVKAVTWKLSISERSGVFNQFEIDRAKKFCDYYGVPLEIVETNYVTNSGGLFEEVLPFLKKYGYFAFTAFSHYFVTRKANEIKKTSHPAVFSGEISDGVHNLGFSQYVSTFHADPYFREYSDKMRSYLYGPTFIKSCKDGKGVQDPIYNFFKARFGNAKFDNPKTNETDLLKQFLTSFFGRNERMPFISVDNYKMLNESGKIAYDSTLESQYLKDFTPTNEDTFYSAVIALYNSFHWNGSSVNTLYNAAEEHGLSMRLPFHDNKLQSFLEAMPENWGRGLDFNNTKYPLKHYLKTIDYPFELQSGPHSYLYDVDESYLNPPMEWVMYSMTKVYKQCLKDFDFDKLDSEYFNVSYLKQISQEYLDNTTVSNENFQSLYGLLNFAITEAKL